LAGEVEDKITQMLLDPVGKRIVLISAGKSYYHTISYATGNALRTVQTNGPVRTGALVGGEFYLSIQQPPALARVDIATGKAAESWDLPRGAPGSLAVLPVRRVAFFPLGGMINSFNLDNGKLTNTEFPCTAVASDPQQRFVYAYVRKESQDRSSTIIMGGQPIFLMPTHHDWQQTALFRYAVNGKRLLLAGLRLNAASNGRRLHLSPCGQWAALAGGGGWRPTNKTMGAGYGIAVFPAHDFSNPVGCFKTEAYPQGVAINPVTGQIACIREKEGRVYHLSDMQNCAKFAGVFGYDVMWSGDGRYLYVTGKEAGLHAYETKRTPQETQSADAWVADLQQKTPKPIAPAKPVLTAEPFPGYEIFTIKNSRDDLLAAIRLAETKGRTIKPTEWSRYAPYQERPELKQVFRDAVSKLNNRSQAGVLIYKFKKLKEELPENPGVNFVLGIAFEFTNQFALARQHHLAAIRGDRGRTNISLESLRALAYQKMREGDHLAAAYCYTKVLTLDKFNTKWLNESEKFYQRAKMADAAVRLLKSGHSRAAIAPVAERTLPTIPKPRPSITHKAAHLYARAAQSVVVIKTKTGSGSGFCIAKPGIIVTNHHVIKNAGTDISVYPYQVRSGTLTRLPAIDGRVIFESQRQDVAVLLLGGAPASLRPLDVTDKPVPAGAKVYAIGSPGLGRMILEQSITEGIVSSPARAVDGMPYIQHTAAVNPGNSGGPLLNDRCQVVGIVTLKAGLENVSFAIPASRIRAIFRENSGRAGATEAPAPTTPPEAEEEDPPDKEGPAPSSPPASQPLTVGAEVVIAKDGAPFYVERKIVAKLKKGTKVTVLSIQGEWIGARATLNGRAISGWVSKESLEQ